MDDSIYYEKFKDLHKPRKTLIQFATYRFFCKECIVQCMPTQLVFTMNGDKFSAIGCLHLVVQDPDSAEENMP